MIESIKIRDCDVCAGIPQLLEDIDCKIKELSVDLYNNVVYSLNRPVKLDIFSDLVNYKRILTYRQYNENYALPYTDAQIASKVKLLKYK
ncbi:MAG: hypothetical protein H5T96_09065 [Tissierellales bacterium]|nr:hypothetical protein [Tissierellales bacterium]